MNPSTLRKWAALAAAVISSSAAANTVTVTNTSDNKPTQAVIVGSLRAAIAAAGANGVVNFDPCMYGKTIKLYGGELVLANSITINGLRTSSLTVSGNGSSRVFDVGPGVTASISSMTITLGNGTGTDVANGGNDANGGAILNNGFLSLDLVSVTNSKAVGSGGGIYNASGATLSITDSTVAYNTAKAGPSTAPQSSGGGIADQGTTTLLRSTISNNRSFGAGGGIQEAGTLTIVNSTFATNKAATAGGGIVDVGGATINIYDSTFSLNSANQGGGIAAAFPLPTSWQLANTIVAGNTVSGGGASGPDISDSFGVVISLGYNLVGKTAGTVSGNFLSTDLLNVSPRLGPLQSNNGPTLTFAELPGSPSINAGSISLIPAGVTTDQRGFGRVNQGSVDIGAVEFYAPKCLKPDALAICNGDVNLCGGDWQANWDFSVAQCLIQASLNSNCWNGTDQSRLSRLGNLTFEFAQGAAGALEDIIQEGSPFADDAQSAIDDLVMADNVLALTAVNDAVAANGDGGYIQNAQNELVQAQSALTLNNYSDAIAHCEQAWINAYRAQTLVCGYDDGSDQPLRQSIGY